MKAISRLKDEARRFEQQEQWDKAIAAYQQVLKISEAGEAELELPLYNRVGDLYVRIGRAGDAVRYYEQAADRYADLGLFNNAIALCNKARRFQPDRLEVLRKLGYFSMQQGFVTDATTYYIDYAERQFRAGAQEEALDALEEFASATSDPEVRELLGRRLQDFGRVDRAVNELSRAYEMRIAAGNAEAARGLLEEIRALDAAAAAALEGGPQQGQSVELYDADETAEPPLYEEEQAWGGGDAHAAGHRPDAPITAAGEFFEEIDDGDDDDSWSNAPLEGLETTASFEQPDYEQRDYGSDELDGVETMEVSADDVAVRPLEGLEATTFDYSGFDNDAAMQSGLDIDREERTFDYGGSVDDDSGARGGSDLGMTHLPLLDDEAEIVSGHGEDAEDWETGDADDEAPLAEPLPLASGEVDPVIDAEVEEEPSADFAGSMSLDSAVAADEGAPPEVETVDIAAEQEAAAEAQREMVQAGSGYVDLSDLLSLGVEETTRFRVDEMAPSGDEDRDFAELLNQFKAKLLAHLPPDDAAAHYDLGLAFREMGLLDEAIMVFQIAARAGHMRLKIFEELGQCFLDKQQYKIAEKVLRRALTLDHGDELELLGVYYHLGRACEALGQLDDARDAYERVLGMDINFRDVSERLARL